MSVIFSVEHGGVLIIPETASEISVEGPYKGIRCGSRIDFIQRKQPAVGDRLQMRHHQGR